MGLLLRWPPCLSITISKCRADTHYSFKDEKQMKSIKFLNSREYSSFWQLSRGIAQFGSCLKNSLTCFIYFYIM